MTGTNTAANAGTTALGGNAPPAGGAPPAGNGANVSTPPAANVVTPPAANIPAATQAAAGGAAANNAATPPGTPPLPQASIDVERFSAKVKELGVELPKEQLDGFLGVAKELGLDTDKSGKLMEFYAGVAQAQSDAMMKQAEETHQGWVAAQKADKEMGGEKHAATLNAARRALRAFGTPELRELFNTTAIGDHPELLRTFARIGNAMREDSIAGGLNGTAPQTGGDDDFLRNMYDHPASQPMFNKE